MRSNLIAGLPPSVFGIVEIVDWEEVACRFRDRIADEQWEELVRENTRRFRRAA